VAQFAVPIAVSLTAAGGLNLSIAGWLWIPLILIAAYGARRQMNNLTHARNDLAGVRAACAEPHLWLMALLYVGTFGSFIGFAGVFPKLINDMFPQYSALQVGSAAVSLAFLGALLGSLSRPYGGKLADRFGGARIAALAFAAMTVGVLAVVATLPQGSFAVFLACFGFLFVAAGVGNGATYRMIPAIFAARAERPALRQAQGAVSHERTAAAAIGLISAIGAYGGFVIPQILSLSHRTTGSYTAAFYGFAGSYLLLLIITLLVYVRGSGGLAGARV
jgi:NNP family nitrate/nitrite transporter-like MFS transporter